MSDYDFLTPRSRKRHLMVVEGDHEKNSLFDLILKCFPEIDINIDDVIVYGTNIFQLFSDITAEYGEKWEESDIDLPYIVSKKKNLEHSYSKRDFTNILLVFDYERQDPGFDEEKIMIMQRYFNDVAENGQLYLSYPMIEAYQHLLTIPDPNFERYESPAALRAGHLYKNSVKDTVVAKVVGLPERIDEYLLKKHGISFDDRHKCVRAFLEINDDSSLLASVTSILSKVITGHDLISAAHVVTGMINAAEYASQKQNYFAFAKEVLRQVVFHNIKKANKIQNGNYQVANDDMQGVFLKLKQDDILEKQNIASRDRANGKISVLSTCVLFIPDYNFNLLGIEN